MDWDWESEHSNPNKRDPNHELASSFSEEELSSLLVQLQNPLTGVRIQDYKWRMRTYRQCFTGEEAVQWFLQNTRVTTTQEAENLGQRLMQFGAFRSLSNSPINFQGTQHLYQLKTQKALDDMAFLDELFKEYLLYRGFTESLATFEKEIKQDRLHNFEGVRICQQIFQTIHDSNLSNFLELWKYLEKTLFSRVDQKYLDTAAELEFGLLRYYIVYAIQNNRTARVHEFFRDCADQLSLEEKWLKWFHLPFLSNPQRHADFAMFFTKSWVDNLTYSVTNFLSTCLHQAPLPRLLLFNLERAARKSLEQEVEALRTQNSKLKRERQKLHVELNKYKSNQVLKIDAHKPTPSSEMGMSNSPKFSPLEDYSPVFLGKQRGHHPNTDHHSND